ncbi:MAG: hypothetical protein K0Q66_1940 [Chitinophagaceae bacterium]|jgi:flagellar biogenesis protein FliO|nr:hypothetical protein [Chitinophagaceae bacterium]
MTYLLNGAQGVPLALGVLLLLILAFFGLIYLIVKFIRKRRQNRRIS